MRDLKRIGPMVELFEKLWEKYPDMRFGQMVSFVYSEASLKFGRDPFYIEEPDWKELLLEMIGE